MLLSSHQVAVCFLAFPDYQFSVYFDFLKTILFQTTCSDDCLVDPSNITCKVIFAAAIVNKNLPYSKSHKGSFLRKKKRSSGFNFKVLSTNCTENTVLKSGRET